MPQFDYLVDGAWYECSNYGATTDQPQGYNMLAPKETIDLSFPIYEPACPEDEFPFYSGRFWYGHYRFVLEYDENEFTYIEFDIPETDPNSSKCLYEER